MVRLQATEVAELREPAAPGHVGSSTMPQKRNPMTSEYLIASARLCAAAAGALELSPAHAGERDMGLWAVEWVALPEALILTSSVASKLRWVLDGPGGRHGPHARNVDITRGAIMAEAVMMDMARHWGHEGAHKIVARASARAAAEGPRAGRGARAGSRGDSGVLRPTELARLVADPGSYLGIAGRGCTPGNP